MEAAKEALLAEGYAKLSIRKVADRARMPLSQIHYHFGSKRGMVLALLENENQRLLGRQREMYASSEPLWKRYEQACDFLEDDLASGYVRVLQEMIAAGWSDGGVAQQVLVMLESWFEVLREVAEEAEIRFGTLGPFTAEDIATLIGLSFLGGETMILLGDETWALRARSALRRVGAVIRVFEEGSGPRVR